MLEGVDMGFCREGLLLAYRINDSRSERWDGIRADHPQQSQSVRSELRNDWLSLTARTLIESHSHSICVCLLSSLIE